MRHDDSMYSGSESTPATTGDVPDSPNRDTTRLWHAAPTPGMVGVPLFDHVAVGVGLSAFEK